MARTKAKTIFQCTQCQASHLKWQGQCDICKEWNTLQENVAINTQGIHSNSSATAMPMSKIEVIPDEIYQTGFDEVDRVLGGGMSRGSITLLSGEPGIGKSTLALQLAQKIAQYHKVLYVSAEESQKQIRIRAERLGTLTDTLWVLSEVNMSHILSVITQQKPDVVILDSIQVVSSTEINGVPGTVSQVRHCAAELINMLKGLDIIGVIIGHITKDGNIAGPKVLEHLVDVILYIEGERNHQYRILRSFKNRFSGCQEIGIFTMENVGLQEARQSSCLFLDSDHHTKTGTVVSAITEGSRVFLVEVEALVVPTGYGMAKRTFTGVNTNRATLLIAAIEKWVGLPLSTKDIFLNIPGGLKQTNPLLDLAIVLAIISSAAKAPYPNKLGVVGEVGLSGEIRTVPRVERIVKEFENMGFVRN